MNDAAVPPELQNSLGLLAMSFAGAGAFGNGAYGEQLSQTTTLRKNSTRTLVSNDRFLLSDLYNQHGIIESLIDQPVDDAFRTGYEIKCPNLSEDEMHALEVYIERNGVNNEVKQAVKWCRLFGGAGLMIVTDDNHATAFDVGRISDRTRLAFKAVDQWELYDRALVDSQNVLTAPDDYSVPYEYYGIQVHKSRVLFMRGKRPPSAYRGLVRGAGLSRVETIVRAFNANLKLHNLVFELVDEAKIDIYQMQGFNSALAQADSTSRITQRIQNGNQIKNYNNAIVMDADDKYEQKQMTFTGLAELLVQQRFEIAASVKMPMTKLYGMSAAGFSSGEDDIENYNGMIESEIRSQCKHIIIDVLNIICQRLFGKVPEGLNIFFRPLRVMSAEQEEKIKDAKMKRVMLAYGAGLASPQEAKQAMNADGLLPVAVDETTDALDVGGDLTDENNPEDENDAA